MASSNNKQLRKETFVKECVTLDNISNLFKRDLHVSNIQPVTQLYQQQSVWSMERARKDKNPDYK